jgi:hypothetical protein
MALQTVDQVHAISISEEHTSGPRWLASRWFDLNSDTCLMDERVRMGIHVVRTVESIFPYSILERNLKLDRTLRVLRTDASWNRSFSIQRRVRTENHIIQMDDAFVWRAFGRYDTSSGLLELLFNKIWTIVGRYDIPSGRPNENYWTSNLSSVCNSVQQNIKMHNLRRQIFCWWSGNSVQRKTTPG